MPIRSMPIMPYIIPDEKVQEETLTVFFEVNPTTVLKICS